MKNSNIVIAIKSAMLSLFLINFFIGSPNVVPITGILSIISTFLVNKDITKFPNIKTIDAFSNPIIIIYYKKIRKFILTTTPIILICNF